MPDEQLAYQQLVDHFRQTALLSSIDGLLGWDQQTMMPPAAADYRADQMSYVSGAIHQRQTDPVVGELLATLADSTLAADPHSDSGATIRGLKRLYEKKTRLPADLVEALTRASVLGQQAWVDARKEDDFKSFQPVLENIYKLKREEAEALGYSESPYDALLDDYEPEELTSNVTTVLGQLRDALVPLVEAIGQSDMQADLSIVQRNFPIDAQERFGKAAAADIGFDFDRGRLDVTHHPFCGGGGPHDVRLTTRYDENFFNSAFFSILHEAGHGLYEQGLRPDHFGLPPGDAISLGIHESQSRMWENLVGRSHAFWQHFYGKAQKEFPSSLGDVALDDFYFAVNDVRPSLIRVEADEATYNLHILIRFELEQALISGDLVVADLPGAWSEKYKSYLGIQPPSDANGVLQDVHWSAALVGYFPTYSLGNLYASQFFEQAEADLGGLDEQFARGEFQPLLNWLREKIHTPGRCYTAAQLIERVTGKPLSHEPLMRHLRAKYGPLYAIA